MPDLIQHGEENAWLRVLEGQSHPLKRMSRRFAIRERPLIRVVRRRLLRHQTAIA